MGWTRYEGDKQPKSSEEAKATPKEQEAETNAPIEEPKVHTQQQSQKQEAPAMTKPIQERNPIEMLTNTIAYVGRGERSHSSDPRAVAFRNAFRTKQEQLLIDNPKSLKIEFSIMDADIISGQNMATIVAYATIKDNSGKRVTIVRPMVVNVKRDRRTTRQVNFRQGTVQIDQRPQDLAMSDYATKVTDYIARIVADYGTIANAGIFELPVSLDPADDDTITDIMIDNETRMLDAVSRNNDTQRVTLSALAQTKASLVVTPEYSNKVKKSIAGTPIRSDITVTMSARIRNNRQAQNTQDPYQYAGQQDNMTNIEMNSLSGFIDTIPFRSPETQQNPMFPGAVNYQDLQCFSAFFVITHSTQGNASIPNQMESFLLAQSNMFGITANGSWLQTYAPTFDGSRNLNDPTALGFWINGSRFTDNGKEITDMSTIQYLLKMYLKGDQANPVPSIGFMMDINPTGDNALLELPFLEIAMGTKNAASATRFIISAADNLTGGVFSRHFVNAQGNAPRIATYTGMQVSLGEYVSSNGDKRDPRDMSNLAMLNLTEGNKEDFRAWFDTTDCSMPSDLMRSLREATDKRYTGPNTEFNGYASRIQLSAAFVTALYNATRESGVEIAFQDSNYQNQHMYFGNAALANGLVGSTASVGVPGQGPTWNNQPQTIYGGFNSNMYY